ncbi:DUF998 domain-containing protein [Solihabitans fulvus]|uniref:DUF998 domain-containing protein n=1 Tax=Solihabitans fulvus TaxID=1892852 RepID=A0A5B2WT03_9PSEU|nr:DUF998 domain-containing protein [Solihabitans fulvus]KAA2254088.1 DUF998 domain-containing protein [Solihabitans fulvus]
MRGSFATRVAVVAGVSLVVLGAALLVVLHLLPGAGGVDPVDNVLSDYARQSDGWVFRSALVITAAGSAALWLVLADGRVLSGRLVTVVMTVWVGSLVGVAAFTNDPLGVSRSVHGSLHLLSTIVACLCLPVVGLATGWRHRRHDTWARLAGSTIWLAFAKIALLLLAVYVLVYNDFADGKDHTGTGFGLVERGMVAVDIGALIVFGVWAWRITGRARGAADAVPPPHRAETGSPG